MGDKSAKKNPSYREVCSGSTGHVEVLQIEYDGDKVPFEVLTTESKWTALQQSNKHIGVDFLYFRVIWLEQEMVKFFYAFHDPTTANRQGESLFIPMVCDFWG